MDLKLHSNIYKRVYEGLDTAFNEQHPYSGNFAHSKFGWQSLQIHSEATASWLYALMKYVDMLEERLEKTEKKVQDLESKAVFI